MIKFLRGGGIQTEIIWKRHAHSSRKGFDNVTDTIFYYTKSNLTNTNSLFRKEKGLETKFKYFEKETGRRFDHYSLEDSNHSYNKNEKRIINGKEVSTELGWKWTQQTFDERLKENPNLIYWTGNDRPRYKIYMDEYKGQKITNLWDDISLGSASRERIGYPTQKPETLLERIIECSTQEDDLVIDPFMGGGTTIAVADRMGRKWIGIDQSPMAVKVTDLRLQKQQDLFRSPYALQLHKYDYDTLFNEDSFEFETWIIQQFGGIPQNRKGGDKGVDGKTSDGVPIQVKQQKGIGVNVIKNFSVSAKQFNKILFEKNVSEKNPVGYIIAFSFGKGAKEEVARLKNSENITIKLVTVEEIVPLSFKPKISVVVNELEKNGTRKIEFIATGDSEAGINFYSWDFNYNKENGFKPSVIIDKKGKQIIPLKAGVQNIAVKVVDNDGLENKKIIEIKINGVIEYTNS